MYVRVTTYGFDESRFDEFLVKADSTLRDDLKAVAGLESVHSCRIGEGQGMIVATYDSEASAVAAQQHYLISCRFFFASAFSSPSHPRRVELCGSESFANVELNVVFRFAFGV